MNDDLSDEDWVTQYGTIHKPIEGTPFKRCPSAHEVPRELSLLSGKKTPDEAAMAVNHRRAQGAIPGEGVRYALVGKLRAAGFRVWASPTRRIPGHVSVALVDDARLWTNDERDRFDACFESTSWKEGIL
ncbi:hypothetical protein [Microbispora sp. H10949]|uniref:hypothetical protein n=1 Tax=Microbispora sp. H10949 TaxID=2729111 RepID=UPI0016033F2C|nr:hypothetical protein [Microbispora sp. H10949]